MHLIQLAQSLSFSYDGLLVKKDVPPLILSLPAPADFDVSFQGQVTRAQEAEENYVIKRELAVVRQQCTTASESLEKAQDTIRELQQQKVKTTARFLTGLMLGTPQFSFESALFGRRDVKLAAMNSLEMRRGDFSSPSGRVSAFSS